MRFSTDSYYSGGFSQPTMGILGSFESQWNLNFISHKLELARSLGKDPSIIIFFGIRISFVATVVFRP